MQNKSQITCTVESYIELPTHMYKKRNVTYDDLKLKTLNVDLKTSKK